MSEEKKAFIEEVEKTEAPKLVEKKPEFSSKKEIKMETVNKKVENKVEFNSENKKVTAKRRGKILAISEFSGTVAIMFDDGKFETVSGYLDHNVGDFVEV